MIRDRLQSVPNLLLKWCWDDALPFFYVSEFTEKSYREIAFVILWDLAQGASFTIFTGVLVEVVPLTLN